MCSNTQFRIQQDLLERVRYLENQVSGMLADRDRAWCQALVMALEHMGPNGIRYMNEVLKRFNNIRND